MAAALLPVGQCPVCGGALVEGRVVVCARCESIHHHDCIEYAGGCAIFACGSRAYRGARQRLEFCERPPPEAAVVAKPLAKPGAQLCALAGPVLRIESRTARRSRRLGIALAAAGIGGGLVLAVLTMATSPFLRLLLRVMVELARLLPLIPVVFALCVAALAWFAVTAALPAAVYSLGLLVHRTDEGDYVFDRDARRLIRRHRAFGLLLGQRAWDAASLRAIALTTAGTGQPVVLEARLADGSRLVLGDDAHAFQAGYHWTDLARIGGRLAQEVDVPFTWELPWKAEG